MKYLLAGQETDRLQFRKVNKKDFDVWLEFFKNPLTSLYWNSPDNAPGETCEAWYQKQANRYQNNLGGMNAIIEKKSGNLVGHGGLLIQTVDKVDQLEIAYSLLPKFWSRGYATEAAMHFRDYAFENDFSESLISIISLTNKPSEKVALKNGMKLHHSTTYKGNEVNIFKISKANWLQQIR